MQALVYDISPYYGENTWLVCFEDLDSGANPGPPGTAQTDNDCNDFVFKVTAYGATPVEKLDLRRPEDDVPALSGFPPLPRARPSTDAPAVLRWPRACGPRARPV